MTRKEKLAREEWERKVAENQAYLANLQVGDDIIITNTYNIPKYYFGNIIENEPFDPDANILGIGDQTEEICEKHKIRGITVDGSFIIKTHIFDKMGEPERVLKGYQRCSLWAPSPELDELHKRLNFVKTVRDFSFSTWKKFKPEIIDNLQNIMKAEVDRINSEI